MSRQRRQQMSEAVFFFRGDEVCHAMLHDDFRERLLDGRSIGGFQSETARGVHVAVDGDLVIRAACCFGLPVDERGVAAPDWSLPVRELAHNSGDGPDLGHGRIRLACRGQCAIPWHVTRLWGITLPEVTRAMRTLQAEVAHDRLGLGSPDNAWPLTDHEPHSQESAQPLVPTRELAANAAERAAKRFSDAFGDMPRVNPDEIASARAREARRGSAREEAGSEIERLEARHAEEVAVLKQEIQRLRKMLTAVTRD